ncbi:MAG: translocation/assembly module TamB domain-containing protein, partial [Bacteroidales bacterium]|nr:translocation/assembly module TamB domain-containing protein [Bacteroidales bacterium]
VTEVNERTDLDVDLGRLYLSPFHHSLKNLYYAFKGRGDLPLDVDIDSLFIGRRGQDTLLFVQTLRLRGYMQGIPDADLMARPIVVEQLQLDRVTVHSDTLIAAVGIDVTVAALQASSPGLNIANGEYPLHGLRLAGADIGISLREQAPESEQADTTSAPMAFLVPDGQLSNVRFALNPPGLVISADSLAVNVLADVGNNLYDVRHISMGGSSLALESLFLPFELIEGDARVDLGANLITSGRLSAGSEMFGAKADLENTRLDLETMRVDVSGSADYLGSKAGLSGFYDIDDESYDLLVNVLNVDASPFLEGAHNVEVTGNIHAQGQGIDPQLPDIRSRVDLSLDNCIYDGIDVSGLELAASLYGRTAGGVLSLPVSMTGDGLQLKARSEHRFSVSDFLTPGRMGVDYHSQINDLLAHVAGENVNLDCLNLDFSTGKSTSLHAAAPGLSLDAQSPMHALTLLDRLQPLLDAVSDSSFVNSITSLQDLSKLDTLRRLIPELQADFKLASGSPIHPIIRSKGLDINKLNLSLGSDSSRTSLALDASVPAVGNPADSTALRLPASAATMRVDMTEGKTAASLRAGSKITDGILSLNGLATDAAFKLDLQRSGRSLDGTGHLALNGLSFNGMDLGDRTADIRISPSRAYDNAIRADVRLDDIPTELVNGILQMDDIDLAGFIQARAAADGLPGRMDLSAEVLPRGVSVSYKPYDVKLGIGETPVVMQHNKVELGGLRIYGADSTYLALTGGLSLDDMLLDVGVAADNFSPATLPKDGPIPVYGSLVTDISGSVTGPLDAILADVDVTVLPSTDITYPIDKKNLAQVKPSGTVNVKYGTADGLLKLGGRLDVDDGLVRYSPKMYPMMPFRVDKGSKVSFNSPLGSTMLDLSASQQVKADVESAGEETRRVTFNTGVRVKGELDSLGLGTIGFFLEAPDDEAVTRELAAMDQETKEGVAAALLATGMYMGEGNVAAQRSGYAFSSILNSRINAALANSKMGKVIDVDISSGQTEHASGRTNDTNIAISKSLFKDRLRLTLGSVISDNPEVNKANGLLNHVSADYKLSKSGDVSLRLFSQRDYDNVFEGELVKSGLGVVATKQWESGMHTHKFTADADIAYRSNKSIGPNLTLTHSIRNLMGRGETFSVKGHGAYYWSLRDRQPGDPGKTDTYKFGLDAALVFPYLHWPGDNHPDGDTRYRLGYKYENVAGGYGVHKLSGAFSYFIRPGGYVTHTVTPLYFSVARTRVSEEVMPTVVDNPEILKIMAGNELIPAVGYALTYNDYRSRRTVNTLFDFEIKEAGNLTNALYCAFGRKWNELDKPIGNMPFNEFVKLTTELCNKFNLTDRVCIATRLSAGANLPLGNSSEAPLSEIFYAGGTNSLRSAEPYSYGPGNFHSTKFNQNYFHTGEVKLEANLELRFPLVWKINGAVFVDAGNVWNWRNTCDLMSEEDYEILAKFMGLTERLYDGIINNPYFANQIALGTGAGIRLDLDGLVIRLDLGFGIHAPYQTYKYDKELNPDYSRPITTYYNMPTVLDALRLNFGIGYPF